MEKTFQFTSLTANSGRAFQYKSDKMFLTSEDEHMLRDLVKRAFAGEIVNIPGYQISMIGGHDEKDFSFTFFSTSLLTPRRKEIPMRYVLMNINGTTSIGSKRPLDRSKKQLKEFLKPLGSLSNNTPYLKKPATAYAVDVLNPMAILSGESAFWMVADSGQYSKALSCVAIDILLSAEVACKDVG